MDQCLGDCPNPFAYEILQGHANPIRALVFDNNPVTQVQFRIDESPDWHEMQQVDQTPVWLGFWDAINSTPGSHIIEVRADGSTTVSDHVETFINPALCAGDSDRDGDVDGFDLAALADDHQPEVLEDFATSFGRVNCR